MLHILLGYLAFEPKEVSVESINVIGVMAYLANMVCYIVGHVGAHLEFLLNLPKQVQEHQNKFNIWRNLFMRCFCETPLSN